MVQWITLCAVVFGGVLHYILIDRPAVKIQEDSRQLTRQLIEESKRNQQLLEQKIIESQANTEALRANPEQVRAQVQLSKATVEQIQDPTRKEVDRLMLERQRLERVKIVDDLIESLVPNIQIKFRPGIIWDEFHVRGDFLITNAGSRAMRVAQPVIELTLHPAQKKLTTPMPKSVDLKVEMCSAGFISPGETINCGMTLSSKKSLATVDSISYKADFTARTDLPHNSETSRTVRAVYKKDYLSTRMTKK